MQELHRYFAMRQQDSMELDHAEVDDNREMGQSNAQRQSQNQFNPATVSRGRQLFQSSCTQCHDAERSLSKRKSYAGWLATVRRHGGEGRRRHFGE